MNDQPPTEVPTEAPEVIEPEDDGTEEPQEPIEEPEVEEPNPDPLKALRQEAAAHRVRAKEAEAKVATLTAQVGELQAQILEPRYNNLTSCKGVPFAAFRLLHPDISEFFGANGEVDKYRLGDAAKVVRAKLGLPKPKDVGDYVGGYRPPKPDAQDALTNALKPPHWR